MSFVNNEIENGLHFPSTGRPGSMFTKSNLFFHMSTRRHVPKSTRLLSSIHLSMCLSTSTYIYLLVCFSISISLTVYQYQYLLLFISLSMSLFVYQYTYVSFCFYLSIWKGISYMSTRISSRSYPFVESFTSVFTQPSALLILASFLSLSLNLDYLLRWFFLIFFYLFLLSVWSVSFFLFVHLTVNLFN